MSGRDHFWFALIELVFAALLAVSGWLAFRVGCGLTMPVILWLSAAALVLVAYHEFRLHQYRGFSIKVKCPFCRAGHSCRQCGDTGHILVWFPDNVKVYTSRCLTCGYANGGRFASEDLPPLLAEPGQPCLACGQETVVWEKVEA
jgi:Zn ribbon nucleic-acid-binding protein